MMPAFGFAEVTLFILFLSVFVYMYYTQTSNTRKRHRQETTSAIDWAAANDERVRSLLPRHKIEAIKTYRGLTGASLKDAKAAIEHLMAHPDDYGEVKEKTNPRDAGIRDLIRQGRISEAIDIYRDFTGVSPEEAVDDIAQIEQELELEDSPDDEDPAQNTRHR
jgi:hypothetical protein